MYKEYGRRVRENRGTCICGSGLWSVISYTNDIGESKQSCTWVYAVDANHHKPPWSPLSIPPGKPNNRTCNAANARLNVQLRVSQVTSGVVPTPQSVARIREAICWGAAAAMHADARRKATIAAVGW